MRTKRTMRTRVRMLTLVLMDHTVTHVILCSIVHLVAQVAVEQGNSCGRDLKVAADRVSQSEQEVIVVTVVVMMTVVVVTMMMHYKVQIGSASLNKR